jgi:hypothetical protein
VDGEVLERLASYVQRSTKQGDLRRRLLPEAEWESGCVGCEARMSDETSIASCRILVVTCHE